MTAEMYGSLLTAAAYAALPEDDNARFELQEGILVMAPSPHLGHQDALVEIAIQLRPQMPRGLRFAIDVDLDLQLVPPDGPATVRAPDFVVITEEEHERVTREGGMLRASGTLLVGEIHSPGGVRRDTVIKRGEYADAGIGHYWMVDLHGGPSLTACHLGGAFGYISDEPVTGTFVTDVPFSSRLDLGVLV